LTRTAKDIRRIRTPIHCLGSVTAADSSPVLVARVPPHRDCLRRPVAAAFRGIGGPESRGDGFKARPD
jgi:hypothetical protein